MKRKIIFALFTVIILFAFACSSSSEKKPSEDVQDNKGMLAEESNEAKSAADDSKGLGKFTDVEVGATLDLPMSVVGNKVYELKCSPCHKLTDEKLVGPGWKGVTSRRKAEWVMNFSTNPDEMIDKDPAAQAMYEECLVRMPNQNLSDEDARAVYEFMRKNDGVK